MLGLGAKMAGVVFKGITEMVAGSDLVFGDGSDIAMLFIFILLGPLCAFAMVRSIPAFLSQLLSAAVQAYGASSVPAAVRSSVAAVSAVHNRGFSKVLSSVAGAPRVEMPVTGAARRWPRPWASSPGRAESNDHRRKDP